MREIKFRIWDDKLKVLYTPEMNEEVKDLWELPKMKGGILKVDEDVLIMQFTGLQDKNGKDIYEGDILIWYVNGITRTAPLIYDDQFACFWMTKSKEGYFIANDFGRGEYEIIGNIYENPELL